MNSKAKYLNIVKRDSLSCFANGIEFNLACNRTVDVSQLLAYKRVEGDIKGFSSKSCARLRRQLLTRSIPGARAFGGTFTLPGSYAFQTKGGEPEDLTCWDGKVSTFQETVRRFGKGFERKYPLAAFFWRVELQRRGAPHIHCLFWMPDCYCQDLWAVDSSLYGRSSRRGIQHFIATPLKAALMDLWTPAVVQTCFTGTDGELQTFYQGFGQDVELLSDESRFWWYITDHMSKHKKEQLGFGGRQWGRYGSKNLVESKPSFRTSDHYQVSQCIRIVARLLRSRIKDDRCPFGWRHDKRRVFRLGVRQLSPATSARLADYIKNATPLKKNFQSKTANEVENPSKIRNGVLSPLAENFLSEYRAFLYDNIKDFFPNTARTPGSVFAQAEMRRTARGNGNAT